MTRSESVAAGPSSRFILLASICVIVAGLYLAQELLIPLVLAILLSFLLAPLSNRFERLGLGRVPSVIIVVLLALGVVATIGYVIYDQVEQIADELPQYKGNIFAKVQRFRPPGAGVFKRMQETVEDVSKQIDVAATTQSTQPTTRTTSDVVLGARSAAAFPVTQPAYGTEKNPSWVIVSERPQTSIQRLKSAAAILLGPLGTAGVVLVITIFMLLAREDLRDRAIRLIGRGQITVTTQALDDAATRISRYLLMQSLINGIYGTVVTLGLWLIGVPSPLLFGLLCGVLRFIPYIGPWIGAAMPLLMAMARFPGSREFFETLALFVGWELITNNVLEPWLYGSSTGLSAFAIIVAAVFWTWLWGPIGLLLSTPLTVVLVVLGKYVPQMQFLGILLGDEPVLSPAERFYQRLLAMDSEESAELAHEYRKEMSLERVYDEVLLPALGRAEADRHSGALEERRKTFIRQSFRDIIEELGDAERSIRAVDAAKGNGANDNTKPSIPQGSRAKVLCLPARDEADEIAGIMLAQLLELRGYGAIAVSETKLAGEMLDEIKQHEPDLIVVSAMPPAAVTHARYICKRVHARNPDEKILVGLWTYQGNIGHARDRIGCAALLQLVTTLADMQEQIDQIIQPQRLASEAAR